MEYYYKNGEILTEKLKGDLAIFLLNNKFCETAYFNLNRQIILLLCCANIINKLLTIDKISKKTIDFLSRKNRENYYEDYVYE